VDIFLLLEFFLRIIRKRIVVKKVDGDV